MERLRLRYWFVEWLGTAGAKRIDSSSLWKAIWFEGFSRWEGKGVNSTERRFTTVTATVANKYIVWGGSDILCARLRKLYVN